MVFEFFYQTVKTYERLLSFVLIAEKMIFPEFKRVITSVKPWFCKTSFSSFIGTL